MSDIAQLLQQHVQEAIVDKQPLVISGGQSKSFYGFAVSGEPLNIQEHSGIIEYEPTELILRARAGTRLDDIEKALQENQQVLASESPHFTSTATLGGMVAAGLSGPSRPYLAALQDTVLGCTVLTGQGEILRFGGKVMKNVAGYDVSRMMSGSMGCLGVILDVTLKVIPARMAETTFEFVLERNKSVAFINELRRQGLPVTATCQIENKLKVRFAAGKNEIAQNGKFLETLYSFIEWHEFSEADFWLKLRDHKLSFFNDEADLWRLSVPADAEIESLVKEPGDVLTEWGGSLHWIKTEKTADDIFKYMEQENGQATLFRYDESLSPQNIFQPLTPVLREWHTRLKNAFDPEHIFNPGKMYSEF